MAWTDATATYYWAGTDADEDYQNGTGGNWVSSTGVVAGAGLYPGKTAAHADSIVLPSYAESAITVNVDNSAGGGTIVDVTVEDGFAFAIASRAAPLYLKSAGTGVWRFDSEDNGDIYIVSGTAAVAAIHVLRTSSSDDALHLVFGGAAATLANIMGGNVTFDTNLFGVTNLGVATVNVNRQSGGSEPTVNIDAPVGTALNVYDGAVYWNGGTVTLLDERGGVVSCEKSTTARTLTNANFRGGTLDLQTGVAETVTVTNPIAVLGGDTQNIRWDIGQTVSFT